MSLGKLLVLQKTIAAAIRAQLSVPWLPTNCRLPLDGETQVIFYNCILMFFVFHSATNKHDRFLFCTNLHIAVL